IEQDGCAEPAGADHQHPRALDERLAGTADLAQHEVAGVAFKLVVVQHRPYLCLNCAGRFSTNAAMPSFWSSVANSAWNTRRSNRRPSASDPSNARLTASFATMTDGSDIDAMASAVFIASFISSASGTTRATRPERSASAASIMRPVRIISMALDLP